MTLIRLFLIVIFASTCTHAQSVFSPAVALASDGSCIAADNASPADGGGVSIIVCDSMLRATRSIRVNAGIPGAGQNAQICIDGRDRLTVVWEQWQGGRARVLLAQYLKDGTRSSPIQFAADDSSVNAQSPRLAVSPDGHCAVVWLDYRHGSPSIYLQRFAAGLRRQGKNLMVAHTDEVLQTPVVSMDAEHRLAVVWQATMRDSFHVMVRTCSAEGRWQPVPAIVDEGRGKAYASNPDIAPLGRRERGFAVVWKDYRSGESDIYLQCIDIRGRKIGSNLLLNDDASGRWQRLPRIASSDSGLIAVWEDYRNDPGNQVGDIYGQQLSVEGSKVGKNFKVNDSPEPTIQRFPAVAMNACGAFVAEWSDNRTDTAAVFLRRGSLGEGMQGREQRMAP